MSLNASVHDDTLPSVSRKLLGASRRKFFLRRFFLPIGVHHVEFWSTMSANGSPSSFWVIGASSALLCCLVQNLVVVFGQNAASSQGGCFFGEERISFCGESYVRLARFLFQIQILLALQKVQTLPQSHPLIARLQD